jgi:hypothetical protein
MGIDCGVSDKKRFAGFFLTLYGLLENFVTAWIKKIYTCEKTV